MLTRALATVANDLFDRLGRPIEEVNLIAGYRQPAAAHNPRSPAADLGHFRGRWIVDQALHDLEQALNVEPGALAEVEADVIVRGCVRRARRPRAAQSDSDDPRNSSESG
jgi:hypothetical protein